MSLGGGTVVCKDVLEVRIIGDFEEFVKKRSND